jgi:archaellum component FlaC
VVKAEEDIEANTGEIAGVKTQYSEIKQTADSLTSRVTKAESDIKTNSGEINTVKEQYSEVKQTATDLTSRVVDVENGIEGVQTQFTEVKQTATDLTSRVSEFEGDLSELEENSNAKYSEIKQTVDDISFTVSDPINGGSNRYVTMTLTVGNNTYTGVVMIDGNVDVSGQLSAEALYSTLGDIARLKVDSLSTSRRIPKYLKGDTTEDYYIDIEGQNIVLKRAWTDGSTEQARDPYGARLYWEQSISGATLGSDGYPYVDGARVFITTENTGHEVRIYKYQQGDRLRITFDESDNYGPRMVWGEGNGSASGNGRGYIEKPFDFNVYYKNEHGQKHGIFMGEKFTHINGLPLPTAFSFSGNNFAIAMQDGKNISGSFGVTNGEFTSITIDGHTVSVSGV